MPKSGGRIYTWIQEKQKKMGKGGRMKQSDLAILPDRDKTSKTRRA